MSSSKRAASLPLDSIKYKLQKAKELEQLASNHAALIASFVSRLEAEAVARSSQPGGAAAGPNKRPYVPIGEEGPEAKRARVMHEREARRKAVWDECQKILDRLRKNTNSANFAQPVDAIKLNIPDYYRIITSPMDLGTVKKKLQTRQYSNPIEFAKDVRQIWINCRT
jgi:hypothetical protein